MNIHRFLTSQRYFTEITPFVNQLRVVSTASKTDIDPKKSKKKNVIKDMKGIQVISFY